MKTRIVFTIGAAFMLFLLSPVAICFSQPPLTAKELMENSRLKDHLKELEAGEIVLINQPEAEEGNELNVVMTILVSAPLKKTVDTLQRQAAAEDGPGFVAMGEMKDSTASGLDKALAKVMFAPGEKDEVEEMMEIAPSDDFNFSHEEIALIQRVAATVATGAESEEAVAAMARAMREILKQRYLSYHTKGLKGLAPYQFSSSEQIHPSEELIAATEELRLVKERFPDFYGCLRFYPEKTSSALTHQFFWVKQTESGRPLFVLKHWVLKIQPGYALIAERRFYLSHSLNSLQVMIGCFPHGDKTLVVLLNQTFTEKVNMSIGRSIAKQVGYSQVKKNILPIFENLRSAIGRQ